MRFKKKDIICQALNQEQLPFLIYETFFAKNMQQYLLKISNKEFFIKKHQK